MAKRLFDEVRRAAPQLPLATVETLYGGGAAGEHSIAYHSIP
jgi:hypothetical protein